MKYTPLSHPSLSGERQSLWEEKIGLTPPFPGNAATRWGSKMEAAAMETYVLKTGAMMGMTLGCGLCPFCESRRVAHIESSCQNTC